MVISDEISESLLKLVGIDQNVTRVASVTIRLEPGEPVKMDVTVYPEGDILPVFGVLENAEHTDTKFPSTERKYILKYETNQARS